MLNLNRFLLAHSRQLGVHSRLGARLILTQRRGNAESYRKHGIPTGVFRRLEAGRPENRVAPIGECTRQLGSVPIRSESPPKLSC